MSASGSIQLEYVWRILLAIVVVLTLIDTCDRFAYVVGCLSTKSVSVIEGSKTSSCIIFTDIDIDIIYSRVIVLIAR